MSERDALLRTIREHPEDDAPRLVFADWLDERSGKGAAADHEWAAAIRQAIDLERLPRSDPRYFEVRSVPRREPPRVAVQLLPQPLRRFATFSRGFADGLHISHRSLLKVADILMDDPMPLHRLHLRECRRYLGGVLALSSLQKFRHLSFDCDYFDSRSAAPLADSPNLVNLTSLSLASCVLDSACVTAISTSPYLSRLRELSLGLGPHGDADIAALSGSPTLSNLERLGLGRAVTPTHLEQLARSPFLTRLQEIYCSAIGAMSWLRTVAAGGLPSLRRLFLNCCPDTESAFGEFMRSPRFATITRLTLSGTLTKSAWQGVPDEPGPANLRMDYRASGDGFGAFVRSPMLGRCVELTVDNRHRLAQNIKALARSPDARNLRYLSFGATRGSDNMPIPQDAVTALANSPSLANLIALSFGSLELDDAGIDALEGATFAGSLRALGWAGERVSADRLERLAKSLVFPRLIALSPGHRQSDPESVSAALRERFPCDGW